MLFLRNEKGRKSGQPSKKVHFEQIFQRSSRFRHGVIYITMFCPFGPNPEKNCDSIAFLRKILFGYCYRIANPESNALSFSIKNHPTAAFSQLSLPFWWFFLCLQQPFFCSLLYKLVQGGDNCDMVIRFHDFSISHGGRRIFSKPPVPQIRWEWQHAALHCMNLS